MNTWYSSVRNNPPSHSSPDWFEALLPASATPLIFLLLLILPLFLLTAESLLTPVYEWLYFMLVPVNAGVNNTFLPLHLFIKIGIFAVFTFTGVALLLLKISCLYHEVWSHFFPQPHPQHVPYRPDQQKSMVALFNWNLFRWFRVLSPFVGWTLGAVVVGTAWLFLFTSFTDFGFLSFQVQFTLGMFAVLVFGWFIVVSFFRGIWSALTTLLGDVAAITEPEKPTQVLYERSQKLAFMSPKVFVLYPVYFLFVVAIVTQIALLLVAYDIQDFLAFNPDILIVFALELATFIVFLAISALKFITYHDALTRYYAQFVDRKGY